ncbi:MAG: nuclear transport factor 2 family protein [Lactobacillaceae bacterium]|jgi:hypothetical protein|nr:nuclear transport factor 2 family protein [Lactobacillaceae bacterium]
MQTLPTAIQNFINTTNFADTAGFIATFTADAYLEDWGRGFNGRSGIASWNQTDNIGKQAHFDFIAIKPATTPDTFIVTLKVSGNGYNGTGDMVMTLQVDKISRLIISA